MLGRMIAAAGLALLVPMGGIAHAQVESSDAAKVPAGTYALDPSHMAVAARVDHLGFSATTIRFGKVTGTFDYDPARPAATVLDVTLDTGSLDSGWPARDAELRGSMFFNSAAFPTARFVARGLTPIDASHARVDGRLTLLGVTKPVTMTVTLLGTGLGMMKDRRAGFTATMTFNRSDFGMKAFLPAVGDRVDVAVDAEFARK